MRHARPTSDPSREQLEELHTFLRDSFLRDGCPEEEANRRAADFIGALWHAPDVLPPDTDDVIDRLLTNHKPTVNLRRRRHAWDQIA